MRKFILSIIAIVVAWGMTYPQEAFFSTTNGVISDMKPSHFYLAKVEDYTDYMNRTTPSKSATVSGSTVNNLSRFFETSTIGFQHPSGYIQIPANVIAEAVSSSSRALTIGFWIKSSDLSTNKSICFFGPSYSDAAGAKLDFAMIDKKIVVRKKSRLRESVTLSPIITTDFSVDFEDISPVTNDITNGYTYFSFTSDNQTCRITISRPGGRLFTRLYYVSLTDILDTNDAFFLGRSPVSPNSTMSIPDSFDDIMLYNQYLNQEGSLKAFYLQSLPYPGVSYLFTNVFDHIIAPEYWNNSTALFDDFYMKQHSRNSSNTGSLSYDRWFVRMQPRPGSYGFLTISFNNAHSGGNIYEKQSSSYFIQITEPSSSYPYRARFNLQRQTNPRSMYLTSPESDTGHKIGQVLFQSNVGQEYYLEEESSYLYLSNISNEANYRLSEAVKVHRGAEREIYKIDQSKIYMLIKNQGTGKYMDSYWGGSYYYLVLKDRDTKSSTQKFNMTQNGKTDYNINVKYGFQTKDGEATYNISPYWGKTDKKQDEYIVRHGQEFDWEIVYIKEDANNRPLYAIRANNEYGACILGYKSSAVTDPMYVIQASAGAYAENGDVTDNFLWSFEVLSK